MQTNGEDLSKVALTLFIIRAAKLESLGLGSTVTAGADTVCDNVFGALRRNIDYWELPPIAAGELAPKSSYMLLVTGCAGDSTNNESCGPGFLRGEPLRQIGGVTLATDRFVLNAKLTLSLLYASTFATMEAFSFDTSSGNAYSTGKAYTFVAVGDPYNDEPPPSGSPFNYRRFHFLGLPNDPVIPLFDPTK